MNIRSGSKGFARPAPRVKAKRIPRAQIMAIYREQVLRNSKKPMKSVFVSQRNFRLGTSDDWSNATEIERNPAWVDIDGADYVWSSRNLSAEVAVVSERFNLRGDIERGRLQLAVDNYAVVLINGRIVVYDEPQAQVSFFNPGRTFNVRRFLRRGRNDIVIIAFNFGGPRTADNPGGVAARLDVRLDD
ncbi:hypothetical protein [Paenibacillus sp.]|uniref:hypothetical protein n=1 Tax=Paenibacillus sp. TaxID=58172 RepID=UPI002D690BA8|nr:hypothetical protein [Paenibacillus sp.]HZG88545.1 hypothetical protein [Paenibacillus sp.]